MIRQSSSNRPGFSVRCGFTVTECVTALAVLSVAGVLVAQLGSGTIAERLRADARLEATETAANILETADALPWAKLTPEWGANQQLPSHLAGRFPNGKLVVTVAPEAGRHGVKRVTVRIDWTNPGGQPAKPVVLVALRADRTAEGTK